jgi:hypothetical protein
MGPSDLVQFSFTDKTSVETIVLEQLLLEKLRKKKTCVWTGKVALGSSNGPILLYNIFTQTRLLEFQVKTPIFQLQNGNLLVKEDPNDMSEYTCNGQFVKKLNIPGVCIKELKDGNLIFECGVSKDKIDFFYNRVTGKSRKLERGPAQRYTELQDGRIVGASITPPWKCVEIYDASMNFSLAEKWFVAVCFFFEVFRVYAGLSLD